MPKYETRVTLPDDFAGFLMPFLQEGEVTFDFDMINARGESSFLFTFDAADMWDAHSTVSAAADEADDGRGIRHGATSFTKAEEVSPHRLPDIDVDNLPTAPRTERVYMTAEAAAAAREDSDDENLREHNARNRERLAPHAEARAQDRREVDAMLADEPFRAGYTAGNDAARTRGYVIPGDPATLSVGSDRYPYTVQNVIPFKSGTRKNSDHYVLATLDDYRRDPRDNSEHFYPREDREQERFSATDEPGVFKSAKGILLVGKRSHYLAPEF